MVPSNHRQALRGRTSSTQGVPVRPMCPDLTSQSSAPEGFFMGDITIPGYLTQAKLEEAVRALLPNGFIGRELRVGSSMKRWDMVVRTPSGECAIEFDGYSHYTSPRVVISDEIKGEYAKSSGMNLVRIPYFVQLTTETLNYFLGISASVIQDFPHGFIDPKAKLPSEFCELGVARFSQELSCLPRTVSVAITRSLKAKCATSDPRLVVPPSLRSLIAD